ncbi:MAG TPA: hypothetical protein VK304_07240 [Thermoleophilaceae bacterium]|nr:hypothetical protein [Thermoleophilaceae bacterium]
MSDDPVELARRALAAAERRQAEQQAGADLKGRLRHAADEDGRVTVETALDALQATPAAPEPQAERPIGARLFEAHAARQRAALEPFFKESKGDSA